MRHFCLAKATLDTRGRRAQHPFMRLYRVVLRSGVNMDITAKAMRDDPDLDVIYFFHDEAEKVLAASIQRSELAGLILYARNSSAIPRR